jgi:hypothetical protein
MSVDLKSFDIPSLLGLHSAVLDELRERQVVRSRNNPTGDYTEWLVTTKLGLTLARNSSKGFDAIDAAGQRYQIKGRRAARGQKAPLFGTIRDYDSGDFDFLVAVVFETDWKVRCAVKITHGDLQSFLKFRDHVNGHNMRLAPSVLSDERVKDISDSLRT